MWKDVTMGAALLLAFALLWWAHVRASGVALAAALPLLFGALAVRHNAAAAVLPLALWTPFIWRDAIGHRPSAAWKLLAAGLALLALLATATVALNRRLANGGRLYPAQQLFLHDLAGISVASGHLYFPASLRTDGALTLESLRCVYTPESVAPLFGADTSCPLRVVKIVDAPRMADLEAQWLDAVVSEPRAYLMHRWSVFREQFGLSGNRVCYPLHVRSDGTSLIAFTAAPLYEPALRLFAAVAYGTPFFRGSVYLVLAGVVAAVAAARGGQAGFVLAASGLLYGIAYLAIGSSCAFRLHWWSIVAALTAFVVTIGAPLARRVGARP